MNDDETKPMTLGALKKALDEALTAGVPDDTPVITEGCDCAGEVRAVEYYATNAETKGRYFSEMPPGPVRGLFLLRAPSWSREDR